MSQLQPPSKAGSGSAGVPVSAVVSGSQTQAGSVSAGSSFTTSSTSQPNAKVKKNKAKKKKKQPVIPIQNPGQPASTSIVAPGTVASPSTVKAPYRQPATSQEGMVKQPAVANAVAGPSTRRFFPALRGSAGSGPNDEKEEGEISEEEAAPRRSVSPSKRTNPPPVPRRRSSASPTRPAIPFSGSASISSQYQSYRPPPRPHSPPPRSPPPPPQRMSGPSRRGVTPPTPPLPSPSRFASTSSVEQQAAPRPATAFGATPVSSYHPSRPSDQHPVRDLVPARRLSFPDERWRYENRLKNLLLDGHSPAELRRRGAVEDVVDKVLKDINDNARGRQQQPTDRSQPIMPSSASSSTLRPTSSLPSSRSQQEQGGRRDRRGSTGSESEAEDMLESLRLATDSPPPPPVRHAAPAPVLAAMPRPQSSWAPPPRPTPVTAAQNAVASSSSRQAPPPAIKVESYRPPPPLHNPARPPVGSGSTSAVTGPPIPAPSQNALRSPVSTIRPVESVAPVGPSAPAAARLTSAQSGSASGTFQPNIPKASGSQSTSRKDLPNDLPVVADDSAEGKYKATKPDKAVLDAKIAARMAMLATRRKVMESQARRRAALAEEPAAAPTTKASIAPVSEAGSASTAPDASVSNATTSQPTAVVAATEESTSSLEDQVADLEKEIMGLKQDVAPAIADDDDDDAMELDEPEEGEIILPSPPAVPVDDAASATGSGSIGLPKSLPTANTASLRGTKRPNAEDMEVRPKSMPLRVQPPPKRRAVFGGPPLRANRLLFHLDDESDDSDDSDFDEIYRPYGPPRITASPLPPVADPSAEQTQRLLAEKEESIRRLKEQIAAKLRIKLERKKFEREQSAAVSSAMSSDPSGEASSASPVKEEPQNRPNITLSDLPTQVGPNDIVDGNSADAAIGERTEQSTQETPAAEEAGPPSSTFRAYKPLLNRYRQLASAPSVQSSFGQYRLPTASAAPPVGRSQDLLRNIDHSLLASIILTRRLQRDPAAVMCPAEVGGGSCADPSCEGIHFRKRLPETADLVDYIQSAVSVSSERIKAVLTEAAKAEGASGSSSRKAAGSAEASSQGPKGLESLLARVAVLLAA